MQLSFLKKTALVIGLAVLAIAAWRWLLPVALPFLLGALVAVGAEAPAALLEKRLRFPRPLASFLGVLGVLLGVLGLLVLLTSLLLKQLTGLTGTLPQLVSTAQSSLNALEDLLYGLSDRAPRSLQPVLQRTVNNVFSDSSSVLDGLLQRLPAAASAVIGYLTDSALAVGTGCLAAFMVSIRLPRLKLWLAALEADSPWYRLLSGAKHMGAALWGWLKAQGILSGMSFVILLISFLLLRLPNAPLLAFLVALVDAVPLLGTGTVLIPWALVRLLQNDHRQAIGLLITYAVAMLSRTVLEPRLVGKQLGLDPLLTLICLYAGYYFWGFGGMLLSPLICVVIKEAATRKNE